MALITLVDASDWQGVYADGFLKAEGHTVDARDLLMSLRNAQIEEVYDLEVDMDLIDYGGKLPLYLGNIPQEARLT